MTKKYIKHCLNCSQPFEAENEDDILCPKCQAEVENLENQADFAVNEYLNEDIKIKTEIKNETQILKAKINPQEIKKYLDKYIIGQDQAKKVLSVAIFNHIKRLQLKTAYPDLVLDKSNVLIVGPSGSGKTHLIKTLAKLFNIPYCICDATSLTESSKLYVPKSFKINKIFPENVEYFKTEIDFDKNVIKTAAYDNQNSILPIIDGDNTTTFIDCENKNFHFHDYNMMIPIFATFSRIKMEYDLSYRKNYETFMKSENEDTTKTNYIRLCEDLYQENKDLTIQTIYCNNSENIIVSLSGQNPDKNIKQERESSFNVPEVTIFNDSDFQPDQLEYIPNLPPEFEMPEDLIGLSKALYTGDVKSVLFHGPAGTGKTANCKLLCQQINMPIMEIINCSEAMDETILGKFIPYDDKIVFKESKIYGNNELRICRNKRIKLCNI